MSATRKKSRSHRAPHGGRVVVLGVAMMFLAPSLRECGGPGAVIDATSVTAPAGVQAPAVPAVPAVPATPTADAPATLRR